MGYSKDIVDTNFRKVLNIAWLIGKWQFKVPMEQFDDGIIWWFENAGNEQSINVAIYQLMDLEIGGSDELKMGRFGNVTMN